MEINWVSTGSSKLRGRLGAVKSFTALYIRVYLRDTLNNGNFDSLRDRIIAHEMNHVKQIKSHYLYMLRYAMFRKFRLAMEAESYAIENNMEPNLSHYASLLSNNYNLNITHHEAKQAIKSFL